MAGRYGPLSLPARSVHRCSSACICGSLCLLPSASIPDPILRVLRVLRGSHSSPCLRAFVVLFPSVSTPKLTKTTKAGTAVNHPAPAPDAHPASRSTSRHRSRVNAQASKIHFHFTGVNEILHGGPEESHDW